MQIRQAVPPSILRVVSRELPKLSRQAGIRLRIIQYYQSHGHNVSLACRHFGISRPTFYRWKHRYDPRHLDSLEDRPSTPKHRRQPTWTLEQASAVRSLREKYPSWGKDKLVVLLGRQGIKLSTSMVGRILSHLKRTGQLHEAPRFAISARKRRLRRSYAIRKPPPKEYQAKEPGDIVQVDTLDLRPLPNVVRKQFTARDVVSRYDVLDIRSQATAKLASEFVESILARMPFSVKAIQVDNGSEFMAEFEEVCQARGLKLFVLPPRSPKLNGHVERAQRTHTEEHWELSSCDTDVGTMRRELREWEKVYNTVRPHQALGYLTPLEFVDRWKAKQTISQVV